MDIKYLLGSAMKVKEDDNDSGKDVQSNSSSVKFNEKHSHKAALGGFDLETSSTNSATTTGMSSKHMGGKSVFFSNYEIDGTSFQMNG
jgi:hypothetical protein